MYRLVKKQSLSLSEQELIDCVNLCYDACDGYPNWYNIDYLKCEQGLFTDSYYPYVNLNNDDTFDCKAYSASQKRSKYGLIWDAYTLDFGCEVSNEDWLLSVMKALNTQPLTVELYFPEDFFYYKSGIYECTGDYAKEDDGFYHVA